MKIIAILLTVIASSCFSEKRLSAYLKKEGYIKVSKTPFYQYDPRWNADPVFLFPDSIIRGNISLDTSNFIWRGTTKGDTSKRLTFFKGGVINVDTIFIKH